MIEINLGNTNAQRRDFNIDVICIGRARIENQPARALKFRKTNNSTNQERFKQ